MADDLVSSAEIAAALDTLAVMSDALAPDNHWMRLAAARIRELEAEREWMPIDDAQIKHMANRFLGWKLPENFNPDGGISFKATFNEHTAHPMKHEPSGTNLLDANQAEAMVRYMAEGSPEAALRPIPPLSPPTQEGK